MCQKKKLDVSMLNIETLTPHIDFDRFFDSPMQAEFSVFRLLFHGYSTTFNIPGRNKVE